MARYTPSLVAWIACLTLVTAQSDISISHTGAFENEVILCNTTFDRANATGIYSFEPGVDQGKTYANDTGVAPTAQWGIAVADNPSSGTNSSGLQVSYFYNTGGANYSDDVHLGYDVCAILISPESLYNNTRLRGQSDNGSCLQTFDDKCIAALQDKAYTYTSWIDTASPLPNSNLSSTSLPTVCNSISNLLAGNLPSECTPFINATVGSEWILPGFALTEFNKSGLSVFSDCTLNGTGTKSFNNLGTVFLDTSSDDIYDILTTSIWPVLTIFLPTANAAVTSSIAVINTVATCVHIDHFNSGSRVTPQQPSPTPVDYRDKDQLSGGAIAGIVIGSVVGLALILLAILLFFNCCGLRRKISRKRGRTTNPATGSSEESYPVDKKEASAESGPHNGAGAEVHGDAVNELGTHHHETAEMPASQQRLHELGDAEKKFEMDAHSHPIEMPAEVPEKIR